MDCQAFAHLYLHANAIATLGMLRAMERLAATPMLIASTPDMQALADGIEHDLNNPETFDWAAFEGLGDEVAALDRQRDEALASNLPFFDACVQMTDDEGADGMPDIARYLARVQAARSALAPRIADSFERVDHETLVSHLAALPAGLPPLTGPLSADELEGWVVLFEAGHEDLRRAIEETRRPEPVL